MMKEAAFLILVTVSVAVSATQVLHCNGGKAFADDKQVQISACTGPPCKLKQNTNIDVNQSFVPDRDIQSLRTTVYARIFSVPLPFIGVDGSDACNLIYNPDGSKASCPLQKDKEYVYKNSFPILRVYPKVDLTVHWALTEGQENIACFEIPAKITA